ncbi:hypothetical protein SRHO_G00012600 [Serrasalmus rhombeus]
MCCFQRPPSTPPVSVRLGERETLCERERRVGLSHTWIKAHIHSARIAPVKHFQQGGAVLREESTVGCSEEEG